MGADVVGLVLPDWMMGRAARAVWIIEPQTLRQGLGQISARLKAAGLSKDHVAMVELVFAEVVNNVFEHAFRAEGNAAVRVALALRAGRIRAHFSDKGRPMPDGQCPQTTLPQTRDVAIEDLPEGGFGWPLIRLLCSSLSYERRDDTNHLILTINPPPDDAALTSAFCGDDPAREAGIVRNSGPMP